MKKIAVFAVFILSYAYVAPLKAEKNEIADARIAAETDTQADAEHNAKNDINHFYCCVGSSTLVTISAIGCAFFGCWLGNALDPPYQSHASTDPEGMLFPGILSTGVIYGCLGGWGLVLQGLSMEYINWEVECRPSV